MLDIYLTSGLAWAILWGLKKSIVDSITRNIPENANRDPVIVAVKTSNLRDSIEIDPEVNMPLAQEIPNLRDEIYQWYRHKGDIKLKIYFHTNIFHLIAFIVR